ncbi:MAG: 4Fe-4S binding protein [Clostridia bacterium]|nr:4Fe-4S binding protein [Clostridia bacterium]
MDLSIRLLGLTFDNPLLPASGPLVDSLDNLLYFNEHDVGGLVTKTISLDGAQVAKPCIVASRHMVHNTELWSELPHEMWVENILPNLKQDLRKPLIVSVGYTAEDLNILVPKLNPYADFFEVSTHYNRDALKSLVTAICSSTDKPVFIKLSPHIDDYLGFVKDVVDCGASGVVAVNSLGPGVVINLEKRSVTIGIDGGKSWVSGPAIKPVALNRVMNIRKSFPDLPIIACGGVESAKDVIEFMLAGADLVQMLSAALINGRGLYDEIVEHLPKVLETYHFESMEDVRHTSLSYEVVGGGDHPSISDDACVHCGLCVKICPERALSLQKTVIVNKMKCMRCGLCESRCPSKAISGVL